MSDFKMIGLIKLFLVLIGIIGAGIANGLCYVKFGFPEMLGYMAIPTATCAVLLYWHRRFSKDWEKPLSLWDDGFHTKWFLVLFSLSVLVLLLLLLVVAISGKVENSLVPVLIASVTLAVASGIASVREDAYADGWISIA